MSDEIICAITYLPFEPNMGGYFVGRRGLLVVKRERKMRMFESKATLKRIYSEWQSRLPSQGLDLTNFSPPLLLNIPDDYRADANNCLVFGQETFGWSWTKQLRQEYPKYEADYEFNDLGTLADFSKNNDSIDALLWGYEQFDFASKQPRTATSPFWTAFREVKSWGFDNVIWSNLGKCDFQGGSLLQLDAESQGRFFSSQAPLITGEFDALVPKAAVFFTGPNYDKFLDVTFPGIVFEPISDGIVRLDHVSLPQKTFRTYHPSYLRRSDKWDVLVQIRSLMR
jgi:hypothetical protein